MSSRVSGLLRRAKLLMDGPAKWSRGAMCRDIKGKPTSYDMAAAVSFCPIGAVLRQGQDEPEWVRQAAIAMLKAALPNRRDTISSYNDGPSREHGEIMALFEDAIGRAAL
jgi:hypothetical protein